MGLRYGATSRGLGVDTEVWTSQDQTTLTEFAVLVKDCESKPLIRLALQVAGAEYPELLVEAFSERFGAIADDVRERLPQDATDGDKIVALNEHLFKRMKFRGDDGDYHNPMNSYLNDVLKRRKGLPISLSILYLDIASRLELAMNGVGLPGHFIVRYVGGGAVGGIFVDPYNEGQVLSKEECVELVGRLSGGRLPWHDDYLREVDNRYVLTRLLNNLKGCYARLADLRRGLRIQNYLLALHPNAAHELRDRGLLLRDLQSYRGALRDLEAYQELVPNAPDGEAISDFVFELKKKVSEFQ